MAPKTAEKSATPRLVRPFIARLARQQLEDLLEQAVASGVTPTLTTIKGLLPEAQRTRQINKVSVLW